jgi:hypothetical protein
MIRITYLQSNGCTIWYDITIVHQFLYLSFYEKYKLWNIVYYKCWTQQSHHYYHPSANTRQPYLIIIFCIVYLLFSIFCTIATCQNCFYRLKEAHGIPEITHDKRKQHVACVLLHLHAYNIVNIVGDYYIQETTCHGFASKIAIRHA